MASFSDIRAGIAANLVTLNDPGITVGDGLIPVQISRYALDDPAPPTIMVTGIDEIDYRVVMGGRGADLRVFVQAYVGTTVEIGAQIVLDPMLLGDTAVKKLIESDPQLTSRMQDDGTVLTAQGAAVEDLFVSTMSGHKIFVLPQKRVLGAEWVVEMTLTD